MPWFVCFEYPPTTGHGFHRNRVGLSVSTEPDENAISEVRQSLEDEGYKNLSLFDVFQYQENDDA